MGRKPKLSPLATANCGIKEPRIPQSVTDDPVGLDYTKALSDPAVAEANLQKANEYKIANTTRLLSDGADANAQDDQGFTALHFAAASGTSVEVAQLLLDAGPTLTYATITMKRRCIWRWPIKRRESFPSCDCSANAVPMRQYRRTTGSRRSNTLNATEGRSYANCSPISFEANGTRLAPNPAS
jgi:ankyrin repeat protein